MAGTREPRHKKETNVSKSGDDPYKQLGHDVKLYIKSFYKHIVTQDLTEIETDYCVKFPKLTEQYFKTTRWPSAEVIAPHVSKDPLFIMLYNELYYRHVYAHVTAFPELEEAHQSYLNYCALFEALLKPSKPVPLNLPNQWLWDIIDEFIYQFQKFSNYRNKSKRKPDDDAFIKQNPNTWSIHGVLNVLFKLVDKSNINQQLSYYAMERDPDEVAGVFGQCPLYKMLGYFSLVGLCRVHCLLGDYLTALRALEHVQLGWGRRGELYHEVPACHAATGYYVGFAYLALRRFSDATRTLAHTLTTVWRWINSTAANGSSGGVAAVSAVQKEYVMKQADQVASLLTIAITLDPMPIDQNVEQHLKEKFAENLNRMEQGQKDEYGMCFDRGCPRFINPDAKATERTTYVLDPQRHQGNVFRDELEHLWLDLPRLRSFLKLYTSLPTAKLASFLGEEPDEVHALLMRFKHQLKNVTCTGEGSGILEGTLQLHCDTDFYVDGEMVHIADMKADRRFSEYFMLQLEKLRELNDQLDDVEKKLNATNIQV